MSEYNQNDELDESPVVEYDDDDLDLSDAWSDGDVCPHCGSDNTIRIDTVSRDPDIWACQCGTCGEVFEVIVP